jgi:hypothetical protein
MSEKANGKVTAQTSDGDAIAAREAREDERTKTEQQRAGGALEVIHPHPHEKCIADFIEAIHQRAVGNKFLIPVTMLMGSCSGHLSIFARKRRTSIDRVRQHLRRHRDRSNSHVARGNGLHGSNCGCAVSLDSCICSKIQQVLWAYARLDHDFCLDLLVYLKRSAYVQHYRQPCELQ